jgi:hypothetical protein
MPSYAQENDSGTLLLLSSSYFGGGRNDVITAVAADSAGHTYLAGETQSKDLPGKPVTGSMPAAVNSGFVAKMKPGGEEAVWAVIAGGDSNTRINAMTVDASGNVFVTGRTGSRNFPLMQAVQTNHGGLNIGFLMKLDPEGKLLFSTFLGGERNDEPNAIALDSRGNIYIAGRTNSSAFPLKNALHSTAAGGDAFIAKFSPDYKLEYSTYFGGTGADEIFAIAVGPDDSLYVAGDTYSPNLGTEGAWLKQVSGTSGFVAKIAPAGDGIVYFSYIGGRGGSTRAQALAVDANGSAFVTGYTSVKDLPTTEKAIQPKYAGGFRDAFLLKLTPEGSAPEYLTYLGGSFNGKQDPDDTTSAVKMNPYGHVYVAGETSSLDFVTRRPLQDAPAGLQEAYLMRLDINSGRIIYSTFWGGSKEENLLALALGPGENATIAGETASTDLRLEKAVRKMVGGSLDAFFTRVCAPWVFSYPSPLRVDWTIGQPAPEALQVGAYDGCEAAQHRATRIEVSEPWLSVTPESGAMPLQMKVLVNTDGLAAGEYKGTITVTVPEAFNGPLQIPVTLAVADPPPAAVEESPVSTR